MSISSVQVLLLNTILIQKEPGLLGEMANSRTEEQEGQDEPEAASRCTRKQGSAQ